MTDLILMFLAGCIFASLVIFGVVILLRTPRSRSNVADSFHIYTLEDRMKTRGFDRGFRDTQPMWTYKTETKYVPTREIKPKTGTMGAQPKHDPGPKPEAKETN